MWQATEISYWGSHTLSLHTRRGVHAQVHDRADATEPSLYKAFLVEFLYNHVRMES